MKGETKMWAVQEDWKDPTERDGWQFTAVHTNEKDARIDLERLMWCNKVFRYRVVPVAVRILPSKAAAKQKGVRQHGRKKK